MDRLPPHTEFYSDGVEWPTTPLLQAAERAYREAFLKSARQAARWQTVDEKAVKAAWDRRKRVCEQAKLWVPSSLLFDDPRYESEQVVFKPDHEVDASRCRGRVHGFEFVKQCRDELVKAGVAEHVIGPVIIVPWLKRIEEWFARDIDPGRIFIPPWPDEQLTEKQRAMLEQAKRVIANCDPTKPHAILQHLDLVTREMLEWLWPGRIPLGKLTLLAGDPGLGKSFVTLDIAARVSRGEAWPDTPLLKQTPGGVLLFNAEDDLADTIAPRLDKAGADDTKIIAVDGVSFGDSKRPFSLDTDLPRLDEILADNSETRLVVVDPIGAYCGNVDSHKNADVRRLLAPLADLASKHRVAVVTVTHLSKSGGTKAVYRAMGSLAFAAASRAVWAIVKDQNDPQRRLFLPAKLNLAQDPDGLAYRIKEGVVVWEPGPVRMHADDAFAAEVRAANGGSNRGAERRVAANWLRDELAKGSRPASELIEVGEQRGFTKRTLQRALTAIGGERKKDMFDGPWLWSLDAEDASEGVNKPTSL